MKYIKSFDKWNLKKKILDEKDAPNPKTRDIWWAYTGLNIGNEQNGGNKSFQRPILILKKFNSKISLTLPLTSKDKQGIYYHKLKTAKKHSTIILSQIKLTSNKRLRRKIERLKQEEFKEILDKTISLIK